MPADLLKRLIQKYCTRGIIIDSNLVLLLVIGIYNPARIATFKRTQKYRPRDFELLVALLQPFPKRITTPNIMTEVDNFCRQLPENEYPLVARKLQELCQNLFEVYHDSSNVMSNINYHRVGLTDTGTIVSSPQYLVLTDDYALSGRLEALGRDVINLNHLRLA
jgi:hypothetical protein